MMKTTAAFGPEPILSSAAQEKSRRASFLVKQGQTRQMEKGVVFGTSLLGYDVKDGSSYRRWGCFNATAMVPVI